MQFLAQIRQHSGALDDFTYAYSSVQQAALGDFRIASICEQTASLYRSRGEYEPRFTQLPGNECGVDLF